MRQNRRRSTALAVAVTSANSPSLAEKILTAEQMAQDIYKVNLSRDQLLRGQRLLKAGRWNLDGLSWYNITQLEF